jgi:hypothetical protein
MPMGSPVDGILKLRGTRFANATSIGRWPNHSSADGRRHFHSVFIANHKMVSTTSKISRAYEEVIDISNGSVIQLVCQRSSYELPSFTADMLPLLMGVR